MKKLLRKVLNQPRVEPPETGGRITNETVAEHREKVLAGGRKFKYPLQYTKHRLLFISIAIVSVAIIGFLGFCAWQLYGAQSTDRLTYRLTQIVPLPVAKLDGEWVRYSDYLLELRSAIHYLSTKEAVNFNSDDGRRQLEYQKRLAMDKAVEHTLVKRLARDNNIEVSDGEVNEFVRLQISSDRLGVSEEEYRETIRDYYDWTFDEYRNAVRQQLLRKKVMAKLDVESRAKAEEIVAKLDKGADFDNLAKQESEDLVTRDQGGNVGFVDKRSQDPNGLIAAANALKPKQHSKVIEGVDGFYIIMVIKKTNSQVHLAKIFVRYKIIDKKLTELRQDHKLEEYIGIKNLQPAGQ